MSEGVYEEVSLTITLGIDYIIYINKCEDGNIFHTYSLKLLIRLY